MHGVLPCLNMLPGQHMRMEHSCLHVHVLEKSPRHQLPMFTCMCDPCVDRSTCICVIENPARHRRKKILCSASQGAKLNQHSFAVHAKCSSQSPTYSHVSHVHAPMQSFTVPAHATRNACCPTCALACICNLACSSLQRIGMFLHASIVISYEWVELCSNPCALWHYLLRSCPDNGEHHMVMQGCAPALMLAGGEYTKLRPRMKCYLCACLSSHSCFTCNFARSMCSLILLHNARCHRIAAAISGPLCDGTT